MIRLIPPVAVKIKLKDIFFSLKLFLKGGSYLNFIDALKKLTGFKQIFLFSSGRQGLFYLLNALAEDHKERKEVILPAYTCPSVLTAIIESGLVPVLVDIDKSTFNIDQSKIKEKLNPDTLSVIYPCMFGKTDAISDLGRMLSAKGISLILDLAQSFSPVFINDIALTGNKNIYCFLSFGKAKSISTLSGGAVLSNNDALSGYLNNLKKENIGIASLIIQLFKLFIFSFAVRPRIFFFTSLLMKAAQNNEDHSFSRNIRFSALQAAIGCAMVRHIDEINEERINNGKKLFNMFKTHDTFILQNDQNNIYLRFAFLCKSIEQKNDLVNAFKNIGIQLSTAGFPCLKNYSLTIKNNMEDFPVASRVAEYILCLPTHGFLKQTDIDNIRVIINDLPK